MGSPLGLAVLRCLGVANAGGRVEGLPWGIAASAASPHGGSPNKLRVTGGAVMSSRLSTSVGSRLFLGIGLIVATGTAGACIPAKEDEPPPDDPPLRIAPSWVGSVTEACASLFDSDTDGVFEERYHRVLDDQKRVARTTTRVDNGGGYDELYLVQRDGLTHDREHVTLDRAGDVASFGNVHRDFDESGRLIHELYEGSDARIPLANVSYRYDDDGRLTEMQVESLRLDVVDHSRQRYQYDEDGEVILHEIDDGDDGTVDVSTEYTREAEARGVLAQTETLTDDDGRHVTHVRYDADGALLERERDDDDDGVIDFHESARLESDRVLGYDVDEGDDGTIDKRSEWTLDETALSLDILTTEADGTPLVASRFEYACWTAPVERGGCAEPFFQTEAFGCARFAPGPALDQARGAPSLSATPDGTLLVVDGYASYEMSGAITFSEVLAVDGVDPLRVPMWPFAWQRAAAVDPADGTLVLVGGLYSGVMQTRVVRVGLDGEADVADVELLTGRYGARALIYEDGAILVAGGRASGGAATTSELLVGAAASEQAVPVALAPYHATLTKLDATRALYAGGDDGLANPTATAQAALFDRTSGQWQPVVLPTPRTDHAAVPTEGGALLIAGTNDAGATADVTLIDADTLAVTARAPLPHAVARPAAALLPDGRVLVAGGATATGATDRTFVYDGALDSWAEGPRLRVARSDASMLKLADGRIVLVGGVIRLGQTTSAVDVLELE